ncbi:MAG: hypothetical protein V4677_17230 [Bacteroidota bacterium]
METTFNKPKNKGFLMIFILSILSICATAQQSDKFVNNLTNDLAKDSHVSLMIVGGIALFGVIIFIVAKIAAKYQKTDEHKVQRPFYHRHHHHHQHHRMIKKSS